MEMEMESDILTLARQQARRVFDRRRERPNTRDPLPNTRDLGLDFGCFGCFGFGYLWSFESCGAKYGRPFPPSPQ